jgi:hypothetical protein
MREILWRASGKVKKIIAMEAISGAVAANAPHGDRWRRSEKAADR